MQHRDSASSYYSSCRGSGLFGIFEEPARPRIWGAFLFCLESRKLAAMLVPDMRVIMVVLLSTAVLCARAAAQEVKTNATPEASTAAPAGGGEHSPPKPKPLTAEEKAQYAKLTQAELELSAQIKLLNELADEHVRRADEASVGMPDKARWEMDRGRELRSRSTGLLGQLNELTKERVAFQAGHGPAIAAGFSALEDRKPLNPEELAYVMSLDQRLVKVRQELLAVDQAAKGFYAELQTNNTPETMERISYLLDENGRQARQWEREESDLQLKKLEFRALRK